MCVYSVALDDKVMESVRPHFQDEAALQQWLEQQVQQLVAQFAKESKRKIDSTPVWANYQLSPEILAMAPRERKPIYGDYKEELSTILEEEYARSPWL